MDGRSPERLVQAAVAFGVSDERVLEAIREVPRADFVPQPVREEAYEDAPLRIGFEQVTTQPSLVAKMVEALELGGDERVLEVGTGYGWQTALLARLASSVVSVDRFADLADTARANLERRGVDNVRVLCGDGSEGSGANAPFDAIVVSAAFPGVPAPLEEQLVEGGRLVQPIGPGGDDVVVQYRKGPDGLQRVRTLTGARFVRLVGRYGFADRGEEGT